MISSPCRLYLVNLILNKPIQGFDDSPHVLRYRLHPLLTLWRPVVIICTFKEVAQTFGREANLSGLTQSDEDNRIGSCCSPRLSTGLGQLQATFHDVNFCLALTPGVEAIRFLSLPDGVVKVKLGGKVPLVVVRIVTTDVISVQRNQHLIWGHAGCPAIQELHHKVELLK